MPRDFRVSIPASSANLGPGFDAVGIALDLRLHARVHPASHFSIAVGGLHAPSHDGFETAIVMAMRRIDSDLPRVRVCIDNSIPLGKGLGSSAAASILGLLVASRGHDRTISRNELAGLAGELEGHPDNAFAACFGGVVVAASARVRDSVRLSAPDDIQAIVVIPELDLCTSDARALLPDSYVRRDVVFTAQRASLLGAALGSGHWQALRAAMDDRLHQPYRAERIPGLADALAVRTRHLIGVALSGAGPSVLAIARREAPWHGIAERIIGAFARAGVKAHAQRLAFAARGAVVAAGAGG